MSIWNKVLVGLIIFACLPFFYLAARALKTHQYWRELAIKHERKIEQLEKQDQILLEGNGLEGEQAQMGIRQRRIELNKLLLDRRRVWFRCDAKVKVSAEEATAAVTAIVEQPSPHGIAANTILHAFEDADVQGKEKKGRYLGEFKVVKTDEKQRSIVLTPTLPLGPRELERLGSAQKTWDFYEVLPRDNHDVFASLTDQELKALLPAASVSEYVKDGKSVSKDDSPQHVVDGVYVRLLRDYHVLFTALNVQRALLVDRIDATDRDAKLVDEALALAKQQEEAVKKDVAEAKEEAAKAASHRDAVATYRKAVEKELEAVKASISKLIENNQAMAGQIAKQQLEAARRIDQRTRAMAQSGTGR